MSLQNLILLQNLYRQKILGFEYCEQFNINEEHFQIKAKNMTELKNHISSCHLCDLSKSRSQSMVGFGDEKANLMIIDFSVSSIEDTQNGYYIGRSGESLKKMCENVLKLSIEDIYLTHAIKCKTLSSNEPSPSECQSCKPYLFSQIEFIKPKIVVTLGEQSYKNLTGDDDFDSVRGNVINLQNYKLIPIYHPSYLLRNPELKKTTLNDLKTIKNIIDF